MYGRARRLQLAHHILYSMSIFMNITVVAVYWGMIHANEVKKHADLPGVGKGRVFHLYTVHTVPAACCFVNSYITMCVLSSKFWRLLPIISTLYYAFQFLQIRQTGVRLYWFIDFENNLNLTLVVFIVLNLLIIAVYQFIRSLDEKSKKRGVDYPD
mmetsp:Transcript_16533/g.28093  ORF Transcript_16533/g.28093 Transcript_16533/m.28093 type:complete len:156 (+) Transcript_16533:325-792(+)